MVLDQRFQVRGAVKIEGTFHWDMKPQHQTTAKIHFRTFDEQQGHNKGFLLLGYGTRCISLIIHNYVSVHAKQPG